MSPETDSGETTPGKGPFIRAEPSTLADPKKYNSWIQFRRNFCRLLARWLMTLLFCGLTFLLYRRTADMGTLKTWGKKVFNALSIALSIVMGLNLVSALKSMVDMMKWSILAGGRWTPEEVELILCMTSYQTAVKLITVWGVKRFRASAILTVWVFIGIGAQAAVAILGLTYNQESEGATYTEHRNVNITRLDHFYSDPSTTDTVTTAEAFWAHFYGDLTQGWFTPGLIDKAIGDYRLGDPADPAVFVTADDSGTLFYNFTEVTTYDESLGRPRTSDRSVNVTTNCEAKADFEDYTFQIAGFSYNALEMPGVGLGGRNFFRFDGDDCGERCAIVRVIQMPSPTATSNETDIPSGLFECNVTVSTVSNTLLPIHELPDEAARIAAGAIATQGWYTTYDAGYPDYQIVSYLDSSLYGLPFDDAQTVSILISLFSAGSLAYMDKYNIHQEAPGLALLLGTRLEVKWPYVWICLGFILGGHGLLAVIVCVRANWVFCKQDSPFVIARLLRPLVNELGPSGTAATGDEIIAILKDSRWSSMTYGAHANDDGTYRLEFGDLPRQNRFPNGNYV